MKRIIIFFITIFIFQNVKSQIKVQGEVQEPILIGCHWKPQLNRTCLYNSPTDKDYYFFQFTNAKYARINEISTVGFNATKEELEMLYEASLGVYDKGNTLSVKIGDYDLVLVKKKWLTFNFSKNGEIDSNFILNKKQLDNLFGK
ncbi:hypothetical protein [Maribacter aquivivus]|uniref:hypothetical protein n=1 Tax=Maribacter aquivivus TaxID=228958 RepID=UPI00249478AA|nr:hypothetical protein [Maribacter aquivivus]